MPDPALSFGRKLAYATIIVGVLLALLLGGFELALRAAGLGHSSNFFRKTTFADGSVGWRENRWCTAPFFGSKLVRRPVPMRLPEKKSADTVRIFVLGSSAAMGDPEYSFSFARILEKQLEVAYPNLRFEVVNAAITAINSHVVRGIAADCARMQPDFFVVYEGNNEVIGPFGPVGVLAPFLTSETAIRATVALKSTRTGQLISGLARSKNASSEWGGMQMFLGQQIPASDPRLDAVRSHFRANLLAIADSARSAGATSLLCTVATNQRDFAPFMSQHRAGLSPDDLRRGDDAVARANTAWKAGDFPAAEAAFREALAIDDAHADLNFRLGRLLLQTGRIDEARTLLARALDLDTLRFRTDSSLNNLIRNLAGTGRPNVKLVDIERSLAARSTHAIIGDEMLYEHVHFTFRGACETASILFAEISRSLAASGRINAVAEPFNYDEARTRLSFTTHEQAMIALELLKRFKSAPFTGQGDNNGRISAWENRVTATTGALARPGATPALTELYHRSTAAAPADWILARNTGAMLVARGAYAEAIPHLERARAWIDDDIDTLTPLAIAHEALGHTAEARPLRDLIEKLEPSAVVRTPAGQ